MYLFLLIIKFDIISKRKIIVIADTNLLAINILVSDWRHWMVNNNIISELIKNSLLFLKERKPIEEHQWSNFKIERSENKIIRYSFDTKTDFESIILFMFNEENKTFDEFQDALVTDERYQKYCESNPSRESRPQNIANNILTSYLLLVESLEFDEEIAKVIGDNFLNSLYLGKTKWSCFSVIRGLYGNFTSLELKKGLCIRRLSDEEINILIQGELDNGNKSLIEVDELPFNLYIVERQVSCSGAFFDISDVETEFDQLITTLRIIINEKVDRQTTYVRPKPLGQLSSSGFSKSSNTVRHVPSRTCFLPEEKLEIVKSLFDLIGSSSIPKGMKVAIDRLNFASTRDRPEDKIIDLIIALESLYGDSQGAHTYKIALRCSKYLKTNLKDRKEIAEEIKKYYKVRSAFVHGGKQKKSKQEISGMAFKLTEIVRESLYRFFQLLLENNKVPKPEDFDDMLLS